MKSPIVTIYDKPTSMTDEQKKDFELKLMEAFYSKPYDATHDHMVDSISYGIQHMVSDARKGYKSKWHPRLVWQRIKGWFK